MNTKTVVVAHHSFKTVTFDRKYPYFYVRNVGNSARVYATVTEERAEPLEDNVITIAPDTGRLIYSLAESESVKLYAEGDLRKDVEADKNTADEPHYYDAWVEITGAFDCNANFEFN